MKGVAYIVTRLEFDDSGMNEASASLATSVEVEDEIGSIIRLRCEFAFEEKS